MAIAMTATGSTIAVCCGDTSEDVKTGQLSPATTVPCATTVPLPASGVTAAQIMLTLTFEVTPAATLNGALVPVQPTPAIVLADIVSVSAVAAGRAATRLGVD